MRVGCVGRGLVQRAVAAAAVVACLATAASGLDGVLDLPGGGGLSGRLLPCPAVADAARDTVLWQSPAFTAPFEFRLDEIRGIGFSGQPAWDAFGGWRILLHGGDMLAADVDTIDDGRVTAVLAGGQRVRIARDAIDRIVRADLRAATCFVGPGRLATWQQTPAAAWVEAAGGIRSAVRGATATRDVGGPVRAVYDVVLSWRQEPGCRLAVAAGGPGEADGYQLELFAGADGGPPRLLLVREEADRAASEPLPDQEPAAGGGRRLRALLFVDQRAGRLAVVIPDRSPEPLGDVTVPPPAGRGPSGRFRIVGGGDVTLESLRVTEWSGQQPVLERRTETVVVRRDGTRVAGGLRPLAAGGSAVTVSGTAGDAEVPLADVREIVLPMAAAGRPAAAAVRVTCGDEEALCGDLVRIDERAAWLRRDGIEEPVALPLDAVLAMESLRTAAEPRPLPGRPGRLRADDIDIRGAVVSVAGGVGWQPAGSVTASGFVVRPDGGATVDYVERAAAVQDGADEVGGLGAQVDVDAGGFFVIVMMRDDGAAAIDGRIRPGDRIVAVAPAKGSRFVETKGLDVQTVMNLLRGRIGSPVRLKVTAGDGTDPRDVDLLRRSIHLTSGEILQAALAEHARMAPGEDQVEPGAEGFPSRVFLRTGDVLACTVDSIDEQGIRIRTPLDEASRRAAVAVPARLVQAVELFWTANRPIDKTRADRLLTLPRMQRANPPTHLLRLVNGDYLRGRVVSLDARTMTLAMAEAVKELPRAVVARVIWLHPEDLDAGTDSEPADEGLLVQGVTATGNRVTVIAEGVSGTTVHGRSPAIGPAEIDTQRVDRLLIGAAIKGESGTIPYSQWKLKPAPEPRALRKPAAG